MSRQIIVEIVGESQKFTGTLNDATTKAEGLAGKLRNVGTGLVIGAGVGAFGLLSTAISTAIGKLDEAHQAFLDDQTSQQNLATSLKNNVPNWDGNTAAVEAYAAAQEALGFSDDSVRLSIAQLVGVTHDLSEAQKLNTLAQDLARAKGIDLATASDIVTKAYQGNGRALKALGIDTTGAKTSTQLLDAIFKNVKGSAEDYANTSEGKTAVSQQKVQEAMERVGAVIDRVSQVAIPILADAFSTVVDILGNVWTAIEPIVKVITGALIPVFTRVGAIAIRVFAGISKGLTDLKPVFDLVFAALGAVVGAFVALFSTEMDVVSNVLDVIGAAFGGLGTIVRTVFSVVGGVIRTVINAVIGVVDNVIDAINGIQIHVDLGPLGRVDFNGVNLPRIPRLHSGGVVPGSPGTDVLTMLQAGETVSPAGKGPSQTVIINIESFIGSDSDIDRFANKVALRLLTAT